MGVRTTSRNAAPGNGPTPWYDGHLDKFYNTIFNAGDIVEHSVFGKGKVLSLSGLESNESARVRFNKGVEKNLILKYANLRLVGH